MREARTSSGKDMTIIASTTARQVKTTSKRPNGPRRPKSFSRISPVATGGMTSGNATIVSMTDLPYHFLRASNQAMAMPNGRINVSASAAMRTVKKTIGIDIYGQVYRSRWGAAVLSGVAPVAPVRTPAPH